MKLHVGCGRHVLDGWVNCDIVRNPRAKRDPELLCDASSIPLESGTADVVMACHVIEHFYRWEVDAVLREWHRLLRPGGLLILELPDLAKAARNLLAGKSDQECMWPLYGDPQHRDPYMCHRWGYTPATLRALLTSNGFVKCSESVPQTHGRRVNRDMRMEALKP